MMNALVLQSYGNLEYTQVAKPRPSSEEVLVRIRATGICGSDVHGFTGQTGRRIPPLVMGHEAAGEIEEVGAKVKGFRPGDRVTFDSTISCGQCRSCRKGQVNFCENRRVLGVGCDEYSQTGTFAEYICLPARILYRLPDEVSFEEGAMVEPLSIAVHAVSITPVSAGDTAVVIGAGVIGLLTLQVLLSQGCEKVYLADIDEDRLNRARELGAEEVFNTAKVNLADEVKNRNGGRGADCAVDAVGLGATVNAVLPSIEKGGTLTLIGNYSPVIDLPLQYLVTHQIRIQGSNASSGEYPACIEMIQKRHADVAGLISKTAPLSDGSHWLHRLKKGTSGFYKIILIP